MDAVLESRRNTPAVFAHGGALIKKGCFIARLQKASSLEGDSLPQTHAGTFKPPTQRDREKLFSSRLCAGVPYVLSRWCAGAAAYMAAGAVLCADPLVYRPSDMPSRLYSEPPIQCEPLIQ